MLSVKIGFVPSYRFRYTEWCQKMRDDSLSALAHIDGLEVIVPRPGELDPLRGTTPHGMVNNLDEAEAVADYFLANKVDALILCPLDFGDERSAAKIAEKLAVPTMLYATKEPPALDDPGLSRVSDSYCGTLSMASGLYRRKIPFHYAGLFFPDEPAFQAAAEVFVRAVGVVKMLRGARIGQIGVRPATFETVGYDEVAMIQKFGQNVIYANLSDLVARARALADDNPQVQAIIADYRARYPIISVSQSHLLNAAKLETALVAFWTENRLSGMAMQCWPSIGREMGLSVCTTYGRLTERGMLTACEADVLGALSMMVSYGAALGQTVPHFVDWTIRHREDPNRLLAWHCGNAPACLARNPEAVALRSRRDMKGELDVPEDDPMAGLSQFQLKPGVVTFCRLAEYDGEWKMLIAVGEIVPDKETLAGTWSWVQVRDHDHLYRTLIEEGFIHHASLIHGDQRAALLQACKFLCIKAVLVE